MKHQVRLSQCMIVKNEEKNIRKALSWGKGVVFEQIVVDTGSSDKTVEIAEEMGAKVYHFPWINDFSAAKNFAIEQASGNWIAFLDADEYIRKEDTKKLLHILKNIESTCNVKTKPHVLRMKMIHLDDDGCPFAVGVHDRVFRNVKVLRYHGKIHEQLDMTKGHKKTTWGCENQLSIFHTGYGQEVYAETGKLSRNVELLREQLAENPKDYNLLTYLGESLLAHGKISESRECFETVIQQRPNEECLTEERFNASALQLIKILCADKDYEDEEKIYDVARKLDYPDNKHPDVHYYLGGYLSHRAKYKESKFELEIALKKAEHYQGKEIIMMLGDLENVYMWLTMSCQNLNVPQETVQYAVLVLRLNKYRSDALYALLSLLKKEPNEETGAAGTISFLRKIYDFNSANDVTFLIKGAKMVDFTALENKLADVLS